MYELADEIKAPVVDLDGLWPLEPVAVPKPWGKEVWYTGIESRGISSIGSIDAKVPLPWLIALAPEELLGAGLQTPGLLKVLDPLSEEVFGDLYFELHEEKREVYVVTEICPEAWPQGLGEIRYGFSPFIRSQYPDDASFKQAFGESVARYRQIRRCIDAYFDNMREQHSIGLDQPVSPQHLQQWAARLPSELRAEESRLRKAMEDFTHRVPLAVGDVVKISPLSPHSLQHGVKVVEFQNPVYERKILSFGQKVLTQADWDTADALQIMSLDAGSVETLHAVRKEEGFCLEQVVSFDDFAVQRLTLEPGFGITLDKMACYGLIMVVEGCLSVGETMLKSIKAALLPASAGVTRLHNNSDSKAICLISRPSL